MDKHLSAKIGQYAIICDKQDRILILQRARSGVWCLPGGRLDKSDNNPLKALTREIKEELNLKIIDSTPIDVAIIEDQYQIKYCVYFLVQVADLSKLKISAEHKSYKLVDYKAVLKLKVEDKKIKEILKSLR
jgi:8-oxo-dGTP pyrophosphatase MutT (NUDIX family)